MARLTRGESSAIVGELRGQYGSNAGIVRNVLGFTDPGARDYKAALRQVERYSKGNRAIGGAYREALIRGTPQQSPVRTRLEEARQARQTVKAAPGRRSEKSSELRRVQQLKRQIVALPNGKFQLKAKVSFLPEHPRRQEPDTDR